MGYYTRFTLTVAPQWLEVQKPLKELVTEAHLLSEEEGERMSTVTFDVLKEVQKEMLDSYPKNILEDVLEDRNKWYDWESDMRAISYRYPDVLFSLSGEGEENSDIWKAYIKKGKVQLCKAVMTFPEFNESQMR